MIEWDICLPERRKILLPIIFQIPSRNWKSKNSTEYFRKKWQKILIDKNYREKKYPRVEILTIARKCTRENMAWTDGKIPIHPRRFYAKLETDGRNGARATESFR